MKFQLFIYLFIYLELSIHVIALRSKCPKRNLANGIVKLRARGKLSKFVCNEGFNLYGEAYSACIMGRWDTPSPVCIKSGCKPITEFLHGKFISYYNGAMMKFSCNQGLYMAGLNILLCNGTVWNGPIPYCYTHGKSIDCDFEEKSMCDWLLDGNSDFKWILHQNSTPSSIIGTGPSFDHTKGKGMGGYYIYLETSGHNLNNNTARLISPTYPPFKDGHACFIFWYHMYGVTTGDLRVYLNGNRVFMEKGNKGNQWLQGVVPIPVLDTGFQIVIEGVKGPGYAGDIAVDDLSLKKSLECLYENPNSCDGRCNKAYPWDSKACECRPECLEMGNCCSDYEEVCSPETSTSVRLIPTVSLQNFFTLLTSTMTQNNYVPFSPIGLTTPFIKKSVQLISTTPKAMTSLPSFIINQTTVILNKSTITQKLSFPTTNSPLTISSKILNLTLDYTSVQPVKTSTFQVTKVSSMLPSKTIITSIKPKNTESNEPIQNISTMPIQNPNTQVHLSTLPQTTNHIDINHHVIFENSTTRTTSKELNTTLVQTEPQRIVTQSVTKLNSVTSKKTTSLPTSVTTKLLPTIQITTNSTILTNIRSMTTKFKKVTESTTIVPSSTKSLTITTRKEPNKIITPLVNWTETIKTVTSTIVPLTSSTALHKITQNITSMDIFHTELKITTVPTVQYQTKSSIKWKSKYKSKGTAKLSEDKPSIFGSSLLVIIEIVGGIVVAVGVIGAFVLRRRKLPLRQELEDGATDVLFLKSDEELDFNVAKPSTT